MYCRISDDVGHISDDVGHISDDIVHIGSMVVLAMNSVRKGLLFSVNNHGCLNHRYML